MAERKLIERTCDGPFCNIVESEEDCTRFGPSRYTDWWALSKVTLTGDHKTFHFHSSRCLMDFLRKYPKNE